MQKIRKAVIPAAGYGTRFLPVTKAVAKEMLPIIDATNRRLPYCTIFRANTGMAHIC